MTPDILGTAEQAMTIDRAGKVDGPSQPLDLGHGKAFAERQQGLFEVALGGDRVYDGNHQPL
jgi:hypothetical protein